MAHLEHSDRFSGWKEAPADVLFSYLGYLVKEVMFPNWVKFYFDCDCSYWYWVKEVLFPNWFKFHFGSDSSDCLERMHQALAEAASFCPYPGYFGNEQQNCGAHQDAISSTRGVSAMVTPEVPPHTKSARRAPLNVARPLLEVTSTGEASLAQRMPCPVRVGRIRRYCSTKEQWQAWEDLLLKDSSCAKSDGYGICQENQRAIHLHRGGTIRVYVNMVPEKRRLDIAEEMVKCKRYRQYKISGQFYKEPRVHVLLVSPNESGDRNLAMGYKYHDVTLKGEPLESEPEIAHLASDLATEFGLPFWNTGVNMVVYRDGKDGINWHSDDNQGEAIVLCVVIDSPGGARKIKIRVKKNLKRQDGDEEIELYIPQGYGYQMDGECVSEKLLLTRGSVWKTKLS